MVKKVPVSELMEKDPVTTGVDVPLTELVAQLKRYGFRAMPVVDDDGKLIGVVSETDLFLKEKGVPFSLEKVPTLLGQMVAEDELQDFEPTRRVKVEEVMSTTVVSLEPTATLEDAAMMMLKRKFSLIPVVEDERLVGIVRRIDILTRLYATH
jgi:CBS domain-containing protein